MDPWIVLEDHLNSICRQLGADAYELVGRNNALLLPWVKNVHFIEEFRQAKAVLEASLGTDFVIQGADRRFVHEDPDLRFVAEPLLPGYLLTVVFTNRFGREPPDLERVSSELDESRSALEQLVRDLPPEGDGGGPPAAAQRLPLPSADEPAIPKALANKH